MKIKSFLLFFLGTICLLSSCYKEDTNVLYSRQYVLAGSIKEMNDKINGVNNQILNLKNIINLLEQKLPVSQLVYKVVDKDGVKDTLGATFNFGETTVYIPFGKKGKDGINGKDGHTPVLEIGKNGNWYIDGNDTGKSSKGQDGVTPVVSAKKDDSNPNDPNFYWTIKYGNEEAKFILDPAGNKIKANGEKGDKGDPGINGQDGHTPTIEIGENGNWYIDGHDTQKPAKGQDGITPVVSAKKDDSNPNDPNFYWTIKYGNEEAKFILDPTGNKIKANGDKGDKGDKGDPGLPGENSPIVSIEKGADGTTIILTTTIKGLEDVEIPLVNELEFIIKPGEPADNATKYSTENNRLQFSDAEEEIEVPYEHSDPLTEVFVDVPEGWTVRLDKAAKKAYIKAPNLSKLPSVEHHNLKVKFHATTPTGKSWVRHVNVDMKEKYIINYFYNPSDKTPLGAGSSPENKFTLASSDEKMFLVTKLGFKSHAETSFSSLKQTAVVRKGQTEITKTVKAYPAVIIDKPTDVNREYMTYTSVVFNNESFSELRPDQLMAKPDANDPTEFSLYIPNSMTVTEAELKDVFLVKPVDRDTYLSVAVLEHSDLDRTQVLNNRLKRLTQDIMIHAYNPRKMLGIGDTEDFDISKLKVYFPSHRGLVMNATEQRVLYKSDGKRVYTRAMQGDKFTVFEYDKEKDFLKVEFAAFPNTYDYLSKVIAVYTKKDGTVLKKVLRVNYEAKGGPFLSLRVIGDGLLRINYGVPANVANGQAQAVLNYIFQPNTVTVGNRRTGEYSTGGLELEKDGSVRKAYYGPWEICQYEDPWK
ncbi:MAG: hypothetical protein SPJ97_02170 [Bacteroides sp.]|nr:hypothetical protein [Bacteroides sp.]